MAFYRQVCHHGDPEDMALLWKEIGLQWVQIPGTEIDMENNAMRLKETGGARKTIIHFSMII